MTGQFVVSEVSLLCIKGKGKTEGRTHMQTQEADQKKFNEFIAKRQ